LSPKN